MKYVSVVFVELDGKAVPAGKLRITEDDRYSRAEFGYGKLYLQRADAIAIDPVQLPLGSEIIETAPGWSLFNGLRDAAPDAWGRKLIDRFMLRQYGRPAGEAEFLLSSQSGNRAGALRFGATPAGPGPALNVTLPDHLCDLGDIRQLQALADNVHDDRPDSFVDLEDFVSPGSDLGGARPKGTVMKDGRPWLVKFNMERDRINMAAAEAGCLDLCEMAGIETCGREIIDIAGRPALMLERFDRCLGEEGDVRRIHMISSLTLLGAHESDRGMSGYADLYDGMRRFGIAQDSGEQIFRRMVMNILCGNTDDHYRNHAFLLEGQNRYRMSPVYDITPTLQVGSSRNLFLHIGKAGDGREASLEAAVAAGPTLGLDRESARAITNDLSAMVGANWEAVIRARGASVHDLGMMAPAFSLAGGKVLQEPSVQPW